MPAKLPHPPFRKANNTRSSLTQAVGVAEDLIQLARAQARIGFLDREQLENLKVASTIILKARELQLESRKIELNPGVKTLIVNNAARELAKVPDEELKRLAVQLLAEASGAEPGHEK